MSVLDEVTQEALDHVIDRAVGAGTLGWVERDQLAQGLRDVITECVSVAADAVVEAYKDDEAKADASRQGRERERCITIAESHGLVGQMIAKALRPS